MIGYSLLGTIFLTYLGITFFTRVLQYGLTYFTSYDPYRDVELDFKNAPQEKPFISIHLAISNEPPELVIKTIKSLLKINYSCYEIIVLDNNTDTEETWKPVEKFCRSKSRITFVHIPRLKGFKAGALNKCLEHTDERTKFILMVDADYTVLPEVLNSCLYFALEKEVDLLQFPQSYRNLEPQSDLILEYNSYFRIFMNMANRFNCVLSTGALSFISHEALKKTGGWKGDTITEDTELGVRLISAGYKTLFVNKEMGSCFTPFDHQSFEKQRKRWVTGNIQVLKKHFRDLVKSTFLNLKQKAGIVLQLTAWIDFKIIALVLFALMHLVGISSQLIMIFWIYFFLMILMKMMIYRKVYRDMGIKKILGILMINQSVALSTGLSWLRAFSPFELPFEITEKRIK